MLDPAATQVLARVGHLPWLTFDTDPAHGRVFLPPPTGPGPVASVDLRTGRRIQTPISALPSDIWYHDTATAPERVLRTAVDGQRSVILYPLTGRTLTTIQAPWVSTVISHNPMTDRYLVLSGDKRITARSQLVLIDGPTGRPMRTLGTVSTSYPVAADWQTGTAIGIAPDPQKTLFGTNVQMSLPFFDSQPAAGSAIVFRGLSKPEREHSSGISDMMERDNCPQPLAIIPIQRA